MRPELLRPRITADSDAHVLDQFLDVVADRIGDRVASHGLSALPAPAPATEELPHDLRVSEVARRLQVDPG